MASSASSPESHQAPHRRREPGRSSRSHDDVDYTIETVLMKVNTVHCLQPIRHQAPRLPVALLLQNHHNPLPTPPPATPMPPPRTIPLPNHLLHHVHSHPPATRLIPPSVPTITTGTPYRRPLSTSTYDSASPPGSTCSTSHYRPTPCQPLRTPASPQTTTLSTNIIPGPSHHPDDTVSLDTAHRSAPLAAPPKAVDAFTTSPFGPPQSPITFTASTFRNSFRTRRTSHSSPITFTATAFRSGRTEPQTSRSPPFHLSRLAHFNGSTSIFTPPSCTLTFTPLQDPGSLPSWP